MTNQPAKLPSWKQAARSSSQVRRATPDDVRAMVALERDTPLAAHWQEQAYHKLFDPGSRTRIALVIEGADHTLEGLVIAGSAGEDWELENIAVGRKWQRTGRGAQLIQELIARTRTQGGTRILLEVRESNKAACAFYEKRGFVADGRRRSYYGGPNEDAIAYTLRL